MRQAARWLRAALALLALLAWGCAFAAAASEPADRARLQALEASMSARWRTSPFGAALLLDSTESSGLARGDVYALLAQPYAKVAAALKPSAPWCDVLMLHLNVKHCDAQPAGLAMWLGTKHPQPLAQATRLQLAFSSSDAQEALQVALEAPKGPMGTEGYRFLLEATPAQAGGTFVHFQYQVGYGTLARLAMKSYLATIGRDKLGFSVEPDSDGTPRHVGGMRGVVERNAMRYHLAVAVYLSSLDVPAQGREEARLRGWFDSTERYAEQLHELDRDEYLSMKRDELRRP